MAIPVRSQSKAPHTSEPNQNDVSPLQAGDFLTRAEFERRYAAHPEIKKAELIEGIVYMPSPVRARQHGDPHFDLIGWMGQYRAVTPFLRGSDNATIRMDWLNEPQPDAMLRLDPEAGGNSHVDDDGYLQGAPEFIAEVAASSTSYDLHQKKAVYARQGVQEYLVLQTQEQLLTWFVLDEGRYVELLPGEAGVLRSRVLPGLWLEAEAFLAGDLAKVFATLQQGLASAEYVAFAAALSN